MNLAIKSSFVKIGLVEEIRRQIRVEAIELLKRLGKDESVALQVEALIGSLDDTLLDEIILEGCAR